MGPSGAVRQLLPGLCPPRTHRVSHRSGGGGGSLSRPLRSASPGRAAGPGRGQPPGLRPHPRRSSAPAGEGDAWAAVPRRGRGLRRLADSALFRLELSRPRRLRKQPPGTERSARRGRRRAEGRGEGEGRAPLPARPSQLAPPSSPPRPRRRASRLPEASSLGGPARPSALERRSGG